MVEHSECQNYKLHLNRSNVNRQDMVDFNSVLLIGNKAASTKIRICCSK